MESSSDPSTATSISDLERFDRVLGRAKEVFMDAEKAEEWLNSHDAALGAKPVPLLVYEDGESAVLRLLVSIEYGATV